MARVIEYKELVAIVRVVDYSKGCHKGLLIMVRVVDAGLLLGIVCLREGEVYSFG
jgi:hypothetical protein